MDVYTLDMPGPRQTHNAEPGLHTSMRFLWRVSVFLAITALVADAPVLGQRQGGPNQPTQAGRQGGPDGSGGRGRAGGPAGAGGNQGREGRGRGPELRTGTSSIRGRVINATTGAPVRRAQIEAIYLVAQGRGETARAPRTETTDDNGAFLFSNLPAGRWTLRASRNGYIDQQFGQRSAFSSVEPVTLGDGQQFVADFKLSRGGAFSGRIVDEFGDPIAGVTVSALRFHVTAQGLRTTRTGTTVPSDDTGAYRVYGLPPGQYYISVNDPGARFVLNINDVLANVAISPDGGNIAVSRIDDSGGPPGREPQRFAPTYYPGTATIADAQRLTLALGEEQSGISMSIVPVRAARVTGRVVASSGSVAQTRITLANQFGQSWNVNVGRGSGSDGTFTLSNIPPGTYTLEAVASGAGSAPSEVASMPITVNGQDITGLQITTGSAGRVSGSVVADGGMRLPQANIRITAQPFSQGSFVPTATVGSTGTFELEGLFGIYTLRFDSLPTGWAIKSITANGVDVSDTAVEFRPADRVTMRVELTDRITQVTGTVRADRAVNGATVVIFPDDPSKWTNTSRFIKTARLTDGAQFSVRGLPPHSRYLAVAVDFIEPGEAQNPEFLQRAKAAASGSFGLSAGDQRVLDLPLVVR